MKEVHVICGTTAIGKSKYALDYAQKVNGQILCLDAFQIYHSMPILSATPRQSDKDIVAHHLYEFLNPLEKFSVAQYYDACMAKIIELIAKGVTPVLVGGTMLYLNVLEKGLENEGKAENLEFRNSMLGFAEKNSKEALHGLLENKDHAAFLRLHPNDVKRVIRALERCEYKDESEPQVRNDLRDNDITLKKICLVGNREKLYKRIESRIDCMIEEGIINEVKHLISMGVNHNHTAFQAIGFKETYSFLQGEIDEKEWIRLFKRNTRRFAKRQLTWLRRQENAKIIELEI